MSAYWFGVATLPILYAAFVAIVRSWIAATRALESRGWWADIKCTRKPESISDHALRRDIWFERQRGPIFTGSWCRTETWRAGDPTVATRWFGIGNANGRSIIFYRKRELDPARSAPATREGENDG